MAVLPLVLETMMHLFLILNFALFAHEPLKSLDCSSKSKTLKIRQSSQQYTLELMDGKEARSFTIAKININDEFDSKVNQVFDIYTAKTPQLNLLIKKPETKGKVKEVTARFTSPQSGRVDFSGCELQSVKK